MGILNDYTYDRQRIATDTKNVITINEQHTEGIHAHFTTPDKPSQVIVHFTLTQHDYDNMQYICQHADILHTLIAKYSTLAITYPLFSDEQIAAIPSSFVLECSFDIPNKTLTINEKKLSQEGKFVLLYLQTIELVQIYIDIYNNFERADKEEPLAALHNCI